MNDKLIFIQSDDKQNYRFCRSKLLLLNILIFKLDFTFRKGLQIYFWTISHNIQGEQSKYMNNKDFLQHKKHLHYTLYLCYERMSSKIKIR